MFFVVNSQTLKKLYCHLVILLVMDSRTSVLVLLQLLKRGPILEQDITMSYPKIERRP